MSSVVVINNFPKLAKALPYAADAAVGVMAQAIAEEGQRTAPVDTGHMRDTHYVETHDTSTYSSVDRNGPVNPEVSAPPSGTAYAVNGVPYAVPVNYGTRNMAAQPWFISAAFRIAAHPPSDLGRKFEAELRRRAGI